MSSLKAGDPRTRVAIPRYVRSGVRSTREVLRYLHRRGVPSNDATRLVRSYHRQGWLDDQIGVRLWAEQWARRGYAAAAIRVKLIDKGFDAHCIKETLNQFFPPTEDALRARAFLAHRARHAPGSASRTRLARLLAARGFEPDLIEQLLGESPSSDDA